MFPQRALTLLAARKAELHQGIARRRVQCRADIIRVTKPLAWLDRLLTLWRRTPPVVKVSAIPVGLLVLNRFVFPRRKIKIFGPLLRWGLEVFGMMEGINSRAENNSASDR